MCPLHDFFVEFPPQVLFLVMGKVQLILPYSSFLCFVSFEERIWLYSKHSSTCLSNQKIYEVIKKEGLPVVLVDVYEERAQAFKTIRVDDKGGSYKATKYLIDKGHKNIGFIGGNVNNSALDDMRFDGYVDALKDKPIKYFSKPLKDWSLSEEDEKVIDDLVQQKLK